MKICNLIQAQNVTYCQASLCLCKEHDEWAGRSSPVYSLYNEHVTMDLVTTRPLLTRDTYIKQEEAECFKSITWINR